jgi:hypothetical protein
MSKDFFNGSGSFFKYTPKLFTAIDIPAPAVVSTTTHIKKAG